MTIGRNFSKMTIDPIVNTYEHKYNGQWRYYIIYGYARVSTKGQAKDGNSLDDQRIKLTNAGATTIYEDSFTGTKTDRPELDKLKDVLKSGDTVIVTKLDRLARSASKGADLVNLWLKDGITVHILNMGLINDTPTGKLIMQIMFAFAEFERDMIVERTQEGKALAKQSPDYKEGRPQKYDTEKMEYALKLLESESYKKVSKITGISVSTLTRAKRKKKCE